MTNEGANAIVRFDSAFTATGNIAPAATISGANTHLSRPQYMVLDIAADRLFVANLGGSSIPVFDQVSTTSGNIAPSREIVGPATGLLLPVALACDKARDLLYVADGPDIAVFGTASTATGNVAPVRTITVGFGVSDIFLDSGDRLYVADQAGNAIDIYDGASALTGTVAANRTLTGATTSLSRPSGVLVDPSGRLIVSNASSNAINIYGNAATITGNIAPIATIVGVVTKLQVPAQMTLNASAANGELWVASAFSGDLPAFDAYSAASGNVAPTRIISGAATTLVPATGSASARGIAFDDKH